MRQFIKTLCILVIVVGLFSCKEEISKQTLGADYYLMGNKENPASIKVVHSIGDNFEDVILGEIVDYDTDPDFILIHRKITDKAKALFEDHKLWQQQLVGMDQYWIIEKRFDGITGPLNFQEYLVKRKQLQISDGVRIRQ
jgi:hypothetical protein